MICYQYTLVVRVLAGANAQLPNYPNGMFSIPLSLHIVYKIMKAFCFGISEG